MNWAKDNLRILVSIFISLTSVVVFLFTTFETKQEHQEDKADQIRAVESLHQDLIDMRHEMSDKLDKLIEFNK